MNVPVLQWCLTLRRFVGLSADLGDFFVPGCIVPRKIWLGFMDVKLQCHFWQNILRVGTISRDKFDIQNTIQISAFSQLFDLMNLMFQNWYCTNSTPTETAVQIKPEQMASPKFTIIIYVSHIAAESGGGGYRGMLPPKTQQNNSSGPQSSPNNFGSSSSSGFANSMSSSSLVSHKTQLSYIISHLGRLFL